MNQELLFRKKQDEVEPGALDTMVVVEDQVLSNLDKVQPIWYKDQLYHTSLGHENLYKYLGGGEWDTLFYYEVDTAGYIVYDGKLFLGSGDPYNQFNYFDGEQIVDEYSQNMSFGVYQWLYSIVHDLLIVSGGGTRNTFRRENDGSYINILDGDAPRDMLNDPNGDKVLFLPDSDLNNIYWWDLDFNIHKGNSFGFTSFKIAFHEGYLYVGDRNNNKVVRYDNYNLDNPYTVQDLGSGRVNLIEEVYNYLWIMYDNGDIWRYDGNNLLKVGENVAQYPWGRLTPYNGEIWVPNTDAKYIKIV